MKSPKRQILRVAVLATGALLHHASVASAANILWDGTGTSWNSATAWSLFSNATTPNPAARPGASDTAIFNIETVNTAQTVNLNATQAALGLAFNSTGPVVIQSGSGSNALTLGAGGITVSPGAGADTVTAALNLSSPQTWTNNSTSTLTIGSINHNGNALTIDGSGVTTFNGPLAAGNLDLTKNGAGTLNLNSANDTNLFVDLLINAGNVIVGHPDAIPGVFLSVNLEFGSNSAGTFTLNGNDVSLNWLSTNSVPGTPVVQNASATPATLYVAGADTPITFAGVLQDGPGGGSLDLIVRSQLTLSGHNLYTGGTLIYDQLKLGNAAALGSTASGTTLNAFGGNLDLNGLSIVGEPLTAENGSQLRNTSPTPGGWTGDVFLSGGPNVSGGFTVQGVGDVTLSGRFDSLAGHARLLKAGPNTLVLTGATSTDHVPLFVSDGVVRLAKTSSATVHAVGAVTIDGGTVQLAGTGGDQIVGDVKVENGSFDVNGRDETISTLTLSGAGVGGAGALVNSASGDSMLTPDSVSPQIFIDAFARIGVTQAGAKLTLSGKFGASGNAFQKVGLGTLVLTGDNVNYFGDVVFTGGTIAIGSNTALGTGDLVFEGGSLRAEGAPRTIANPITFNSTGVINGATDLTLTGVISGPAGLTKSGAGRLTLAAANTYAGLTTVDGGTLAVNGSIAGGATVNAATLAGAGVIGGAVTLNAGATLAPGASAGEITVGSLAMTPNATLVIEIGGVLAGSEHDQVESTGTLAVDGTLTVSLINGFMPSAGQSFDILNGAAITGAFDSLYLQPLTSGLLWNVSQLYVTGALAVVAAPSFTADFDDDNDVDADDLAQWRGDFGENGLSDAEGDNDSDGADFLAWQRQFGNKTPSVAASAAVPEPATLALTSAVLVGLSNRRRARA